MNKELLSNSYRLILPFSDAKNHFALASMVRAKLGFSVPDFIYKPSKFSYSNENSTCHKVSRNVVTL